MANDETIHLLAITEPCPAAWDSMAGTGAARQCDQCVQMVYDISAMDAARAAELLAGAAPGGLCVRVRCDRDGFVQHSARAEQSAARWRLHLLSPAILAASAACSAPTESELPLVVEGPPATATSGRVEAAPEQARRNSADPVERSAGGSLSAGTAGPVRDGMNRVREPQRAAELMHLVMGLLALPVPAQPQSPLQGAAPKPGQASQNRDEDFDFGI